MNPSPIPPAVPDHELLRCVGRGSYGEVWLGRNVMGSFRAVKVVYRASFESERPYEREFSGLQIFEPVSRTHPGLVSLLHIGRNAESGYFYCVMEVADDVAKGQAIEPDKYRPRTLASEIAQRGRLPLGECVELGGALAAALGHLHSRGLVHRDIKPSNIIFVNGAPKFADIGLVTQIGSKATFVGTEGYLAPEGPGSPGADLYALGKLLYEIGMGKSAEQFPELPTRLRELPEAAGLMRLNGIVLKACEPQAAKRFQSAGELEAAVAQLGQELGGPRRDGSGGGIGRPGSGTRVVILCPSTAPGDVSLARSLAGRLGEQGFGVFLDDKTALSVEWARGLEEQIRGAHTVIAILSVSTLPREMIAYSLGIVQQSSRRPARSPRLVTLCVGLPKPITGPIATALEGATLISTDGTTAPEKIIGETVSAVTSFLNEGSKSP